MSSDTFRLKDLAQIIRSKNAGPYQITFDVLFADEEMYRRVCDSGAVNTDSVAELYSVPRSHVVSLYEIDMCHAIKVTLSRSVPQGDINDTDVYGAQQHVPLMDLEIPPAQGRG